MSIMLSKTKKKVRAEKVKNNNKIKGILEEDIKKNKRSTLSCYEM